MSVVNNVAQVAWVAGFYEGEGCCCVTNGGMNLRLSITSTDMDVLQRAQAILGAGRIHTRRVTSPIVKSNKPLHVLHINGNEVCIEILERLWPWLGERRREQAELITGRVVEMRGKRGYAGFADARPASLRRDAEPARGRP